MAYDPIRKVVVLFGGRLVGDTRDNETWEWNGTTWTQKFPPLPWPDKRSKAGMAYDAARGQIVLFGGTQDNANSVRFNDTWIYDGVSWTKLAPSTSPSKRATGNVVCYDAALQKVVLFGGAGPDALGDTWHWDGVNWTLVANGGPPPRAAGGLVFDTNLNQTILFGGIDSEKYYGDVWSWNGANWRQLNVGGIQTVVYNANKSFGRARHILAHAPELGKTFVYGGNSGTTSLTTFNETWALDLSQGLQSADINMDGVVDDSDLAILLDQFNKECQ